jgi:2,3-dihydroxybenzoate decarboxylase
MSAKETRMNDGIGRRGFLGKTAAVATSLPLLLQRTVDSQPASSSTKVKRIAVEEHWTRFNVIEAAGRTPAANADRQADLGDIRLGEMDAAGITMQVIANSSYQFLADAAKAIELTKTNNDFLAAAVAEHPDRFAGLAALPTQDPAAAVKELDRAVTELKLRGAMVEGQDHAHWEFLDSPKFRPLWECAAGLEVPIYLHPNIPHPDSVKLLEGHPEISSLMWAGAIYTGTQALRIIGSGVFDEFPKATMILGHLGELLPYWLGRLDESSRGWKNTKKPPSAYIRENIYVTTSGHYHPEALVCAINALGADHVLFASDYASVKGELAVEFFEKTTMSQSDREKIYHFNAERLFRL